MMAIYQKSNQNRGEERTGRVTCRIRPYFVQKMFEHRANICTESYDPKLEEGMDFPVGFACGKLAGSIENQDHMIVGMLQQP